MKPGVLAGLIAAFVVFVFFVSKPRATSKVTYPGLDTSDNGGGGISSDLFKPTAGIAPGTCRTFDSAYGGQSTVCYDPNAGRADVTRSATPTFTGWTPDSPFRKIEGIAGPIYL